MWSRCSDDYMVRSRDLLERINCVWLRCCYNGENVGLASVRAKGNSVASVHIYIPAENRGKISLLCGRAILAWIANNADDRIVKINTKIPVVYKDVIGFAVRLGFKKEGIDRKSVVKNGMLIDKVCMGILREEIKHG